MSNHLHHDHSHNCDCGCSDNLNTFSLADLSDVEKHFLTHLIEYKFLPVTQFVLKSSKESDFASIALTPVFILNVNDAMQDVKNMGNKLKALEEKGYISLDFDIPLSGYKYDEYYNSDVFKYFKKTIDEVKGNEKFLGDTPTIETGSIAPTEKCLIDFNK